PGDSVVTLSLNVSGVQLWWPNGYGDQPLYSLNVTFTDSISSANVSETKMVGFRSLRLRTPAYGDGYLMYFEVNGFPIFAKGANWVPVDSFENRVNSSILRNLITSARDARFNILRVWGGG